MAAWEQKQILIWGKTRPELSHKYRETVCTGGVFAHNKEFVRLYPIPLRYLNDEHVFKKYQWIEADVRKSNRDSRPESYEINAETIKIGDFIDTVRGDWDRRAEWITQPSQHIFQSVEALQTVRKREGTSIGMVKPLLVTGCSAKPYSQKYRDEFWTKYRSIMAQQELPFDPESERAIRMLPAPEFRFKIQFRCDDPDCTQDHNFTVYDWEVDALYNRLRQNGDMTEQACEKVLDKLRDNVCADNKDTYFFLGNIAAHPHKFTIVGLWYPKKRQPGLFDQLTVE